MKGTVGPSLLVPPRSLGKKDREETGGGVYTGGKTSGKRRDVKQKRVTIIRSRSPQSESCVTGERTGKRRRLGKAKEGGSGKWTRIGVEKSSGFPDCPV